MGAEALLIASIAASAAGTVMTVQAQRAAAKSEAAINEYNAKLQEQEAQERRRQGVEAAMENRDKARRLMATNRAKTGASGTMMQGSPLLNQLQIVEASELDSMNIIRNAQIGANQSMAQSRIDRLAAKSARTAGRLGAGASLFSGIGNVASMGLNYKLKVDGANKPKKVV